jgi:hypothetical protein
MKIIHCIGGEEVFVDDEDYARLNQIPWHISKEGYVVCNRIFNNCYVSVIMGREVLGLPDFQNNAKVVHHKNHVKHDNQKHNLVAITHQENCTARLKNKNNVSGFKGVSLHKRTGRWVAQIGINMKRKHLGFFCSAEDAAKAYDTAATKYHGQFATLNFQ